MRISARLFAARSGGRNNRAHQELRRGETKPKEKKERKRNNQQNKEGKEESIWRGRCRETKCKTYCCVFPFVNSRQPRVAVKGVDDLHKGGRVSFRGEGADRSLGRLERRSPRNGHPSTVPNGKGLCRVMATLQKKFRPLVAPRRRRTRVDTVWEERKEKAPKLEESRESEGVEVGGGTGPGTILKGLIKPAKCHAATHVPSREARKYVQDEAAGVSTVSASIWLFSSLPPSPFFFSLFPSFFFFNFDDTRAYEVLGCQREERGERSRRGEAGRRGRVDRGNERFSTREQRN